MTTDFLMPWQDMHESSKRRVDLKNHHNVFWLVDISGKYGFYIESASLFASENVTLNLNRIEVLKRNSFSQKGELILILHNKEDMQIFYKLCQDLISTIELTKDFTEMISAVEGRLQKWQELLKRSSDLEMPIETQMGLFSELSFINDYLASAVGLEQAIYAWVGPDFDKQDFLIKQAIIEVKSHRTSKGQVATISSAAQLFSDKDPLYLVSYSLTGTETGLTVEELANELQRKLAFFPDPVRQTFEIKLIDYGLIPEITNRTYVGFIIDKVRVFRVKCDFPSITPKIIKPQIVNVKYTIDLSQCLDFEVPINSIF